MDKTQSETQEEIGISARGSELGTNTNQQYYYSLIHFLNSVKSI